MGIPENQSIEVPNYLDEDYFVNALKEGLRAHMVKINSLEFTCGSSPCDNFCSIIYRVKIQGDIVLDTEWKPLNMSLIVKSIPKSHLVNTLKNVNIYIKEKVTYYDVLPYLETLSDGGRFAPKCFYAAEHPTITILLEDLKADGFVMKPGNQLDWNHSILVIKQFAKFHASSMVLLDKYPALKKRFQNGMCSKEVLFSENPLSVSFELNLKQLISVCSTWPNFEKITQKLRQYHKNFREIIVRSGQSTSSDRYKVLNHGDFRCNNLMFKYSEEDNQPTDMRFLDFQFSVYGSPGIDLTAFFNATVQLDVLQNKREELIQLYYETFVKSLRYMNFKQIPTKDDLLYELRARELYGFLNMFMYLPIEYFPRSLPTNINIEALKLPDIYIHCLSMAYQHENVQAQLQYCLRRFDDLGVFDEF